jgi:glutamate-1-semialdehyde 2,1-aminomutase
MRGGTQTERSIEEAYRARTPSSALMIDRADAVMPAGSTRSFSYFGPYPVVFTRGEGASLWDLDGNHYIDFVSNGLSLMHGNAYPPIQEAVVAAIGEGTAWPGTSAAQIAFAEALVERFDSVEQVRFANTGTEATMLAIKLARHATRRPLVLKAWNGYHGSSEELSAGLGGRGEIPGHVLLADFGDAGSFAKRLDEHGDHVAAVILEPVPYTGRVTPPPEGFLEAVESLARDAGALSIIDDCIMSRLAVGGSAERFGLSPDVVCLGKWIGGGFPVGVIGASTELMSCFDERQPGTLYHGGSFNGNPIGMHAGRIAVEHLTADRIAEMDRLAGVLAAGLREQAASYGVPLSTPGVGSAFGLYVLDSPDGEPDARRTRLLHLAAVSRGVYFGPDGEVAMSTSMTDELIAQALEGFGSALGDVAWCIESEDAA